MHARQRLTIALVTGAFLTACTQKAEESREAAAVAPGVGSREVTYAAGETALKGFMAWDTSRTTPRPGVVVVHEWWGHNEHARNAATKLAEAGYVALAVDMYGDGKNTTHPDSAAAFATAAASNVESLTARFTAAIAQLKADPRVDSTRVAAIGYCFGGSIVLAMARGGMDLDAVASFHGALPPDAPVDSGNVKARVLILNGAADPMVPQAQVEAFAAKLRKAGATVDVVNYPGAMHGFTNPRADSVGMQGLKYDATADSQSWDALLKLLAEVFP
ncbi:MAG: dienelactone hydrolase family protein [Cytophagaceae bacterium]|nr:dienelactone hydrolase family protein [Gemmatimonadaceae bacterium]